MRRFLSPIAFLVVLAVGALVATLVVGNSPQLGLDLQGGVSIVLSPPADVADDGVIDQAIEIIRSRVDALGVAEPNITRQGDNVVVELPGVTDQEQAIAIVGDTAELQFRPVIQGLGPEDTSSTTTTATTTATDPAAETTTTTEATTTTTTSTEDTTSSTVTDTSATTVPESPTSATPTTEPEDAVAEVSVVLPVKEGGDQTYSRYHLGAAAILGKEVDDAQARVDTNSGEWSVELDFNDTGATAINTLAAQCYAQEANCPTNQMAIVLDGVVYSAPQFETSSFDGGIVNITGDFSESEAKDLALVLRYGALPVQLEQDTVSSVSPTLGRDSLRAGVVAGAIGALLVLTYIVAYYRSLGLVVVLGMGIWGALQWSIISYLGANNGLALSLAGVTGLVVSVGVTVDSYVVYFERIKDEIQAGRTVRSAAERGYQRAFRTILAADFSALIGAGLLWWLSVGAVRGFAFFLGLSTALDIVVSWFYARPMVNLLATRPGFGRGRFLRSRKARPTQPSDAGGLAVNPVLAGRQP